MAFRPCSDREAGRPTIKAPHTGHSGEIKARTSRLSLARSPRHLSKPCLSVPRLLIGVLGQRETAVLLVCRSVGYNRALREPIEGDYMLRP